MDINHNGTDASGWKARILTPEEQSTLESKLAIAMWTAAQGYCAADPDDVILAAASVKFDVSIEELELLRNDGCVLVRIREENDENDLGLRDSSLLSV